MNINLTLTILCSSCLLVFSCASSSEEANPSKFGPNSGNNDNIRIIAGSSALGRAGSWSDNCIQSDCARANLDGSYRLSAVLTESGLIRSDIPESDGITTLYSHYPFSSDINSTLVNINPSTHAILDAWSWIDQGQSIETCAINNACAGAIVNSFTRSVEDKIVSRLDTFLGNAWPAGRNPFHDIYVADASEDALDQMHDTLNFVVTDTHFQVFDHNDTQITEIRLDNLLSSTPLDSISLTDDQYAAALEIDRTTDTDTNPITVSASVSPLRPKYAPVDVTVHASSSSTRSDGTLTFEHDLTLASGTTLEFSGASASTTIDTAGTHVWVVTVNDSNGYSKSQGYEITVLATDETTVTYGANGSCVTPEANLTQNTLNICEEAQDGSLLACDILYTSSVVLVESPAPCSNARQNGGELIGLCTVDDVEMRIFYYENLKRPNNVETIDEKRLRLAGVCSHQLEGHWSTSL